MKVTTVFLIFFGFVAIQNVSAEIKCYICDNCQDVADVKSVECTEENTGITLPPGSSSSTTTTTEIPDGGSSTTTTEIPDGGSSSTTTTAATTTTTTATTTTTSATTTTTTTAEPDPGNPGSFSQDGNLPHVFSHKYLRSTRSLRATNKFQCFKISFQFADGLMVKRGCTKRTCENIKGNKLVKECDTCEGDNCNPASSIKSWTITSMILLSIMKVFLY